MGSVLRIQESPIQELPRQYCDYSTGTCAIEPSNSRLTQTAAPQSPFPPRGAERIVRGFPTVTFSEIEDDKIWRIE
jgi:hypothetical protein